MIHTIIISLLIEKLSYLLRPQSFSFQIVSEFMATFVKFSNFCPKGGAFDSLFCPEGRLFVHNNCPGGRVFAPFKSCSGGMVLDEIDTYIICSKVVFAQRLFHIRMVLYGFDRCLLGLFLTCVGH